MTDPKGDRTTERPGAQVSDLRELGPAASGTRSPIDARALDRLYQLAIDLPVDEGTARVVQVFLDGLAPLLPRLALGVCVVDPAQGEQLVELRLPEGVEAGTGHDPSRLFPKMSHEEITQLSDPLLGSTFHVGSDDATRANVLTEPVLGRALPLLEANIKRARALERKAQGAAALKRLQAQVIQTEKLASLGQIVAGVVHELNNPLTSIVAYADYLKRRLEAREDSIDDVERARRIGEAAQRILRFSRDLVAYARPSADVPAPVEVHEVIDKALVFCEHELGKAGVHVERRWHPNLPSVLGIGGQLAQVFVNLFTNASHAMVGRGGALVVTTAFDPSAGRVTITVDDDGTGIDPADLTQIFEPFFTTKTEGRGTGLGLSIVRDIVAAHGGKVSATSTVGVGTTFVVDLPAAAHRSSTRPPRA
ncbi:MAG: two-component sensor histidine kinase [Myxococcales bacterium]|nr:two-component sensor histidine kinase [Myxococcales bacterium]